MAHAGVLRCVARLRACAAASEVTGAPPPGAYAITGGLGGLGLRAAKMLVEGGATCVLLASQGGRVGGPGIDLNRTASIRAAACDVGDAADALLWIALASPTGVLHAAGVLRIRPALQLRCRLLLQQIAMRTSACLPPPMKTSSSAT